MCSSSLVCRLTIAQFCLCVFVCVHGLLPVYSQTDVNDDLFKWPIAMETLYKSIPAIHTEEGKGRGTERERERLERKQKKGLEINSQKLSAKEKDDGREKKKRGGFGKEEAGI